MKALLLPILLFPFSTSPMQFFTKNDKEPQKAINAALCYLGKCPTDVCNIIAEMLQREPNAFKKLAQETDEELIKRSKSYCADRAIRSSSIIDESESLRPYEIKPYPDYRKGRLNVESHSKKKYLCLPTVFLI